MLPWHRMEGYSRMLGVKHVIEFDRINTGDNSIARLMEFAKKIDAMCKSDPDFAKLVSALGVFSALQQVAANLQAKESQKQAKSAGKGEQQSGGASSGAGRASAGSVPSGDF